MAASGDNDLERRPGELVNYGLGASGYMYHKGAAFMRDGASGALRPVAGGVTGSIFLGVVDRSVAGPNGSNGLSVNTINAWAQGEFTFNAQGTGASAHIGQKAYFMDDITVGVSAAVSNVLAGVVTGLESTDKYRVRITSAIGRASGTYL